MSSRAPARGTPRTGLCYDRRVKTFGHSMKLNRQCIIGLTLGAIGLTLAACVPGDGGRHVGPGQGTGPLKLVAYDSCDAAVSSLKAAARIATRQYRETLVTEGRPGVV